MSRKLVGLALGIAGAAAAVVLATTLAHAGENSAPTGTQMTSDQGMATDCVDMRDMTCLNSR